MPPRPAPDLALRRTQVIDAAWSIAESEGWPAVTMRRLAGELSATQPVLYSAFSGRQGVIDAVALRGFTRLADALEAAEEVPLARMNTYLQFAAAHPVVYEAMFSMPSSLGFDSGEQGPLLRAFTALRSVFPERDEVRAEIGWAMLHGLASLQASGRLPESRREERLAAAHDVLTS